MKYLNKNQDNDELMVAQCDAPCPNANEVLIEVRASGINRADLLQIAGHYPPPRGASDIIGLEVAGVVTSAPKDSRFAEGDSVMALLAGGGYGEYVAVDSGSVMTMPAGLSFEQGAAIPEAFITAYQALFTIGKLNERLTGRRKPRVLIHAGASGVGSAAIQLALAAGCEVFTTASSDDKLAALKELGPIVAINYKNQCFKEVITKQTGREGIDIIVDFIAAEYLERNIGVLAMDGIIVTLAMLGGRFAPSLDFAKLLTKRGTLTASTLRNRSDQYKTELVAAFEQQFLPLFESGALKPIIDSSYRYKDVNLALAHIAGNKNIGKLILHSF